MRVQALEVDVLYLRFGAYAQPVAYEADITNVQKGPIQFTGMELIRPRPLDPWT